VERDKPKKNGIGRTNFRRSFHGNKKKGDLQGIIKFDQGISEKSSGQKCVEEE
jgi:hypothetical protein